MRRGPYPRRNGKVLGPRSYDECAAAVRYWVERGLSERTALIMADVVQSRFAPLCRDIKQRGEE